MATETSALVLPSASATRATPRLAGTQQAISSLAYDRVFVVLSAWVVGGLFVDGWAHVNLRSLETFFTPWHGLFYSGFFAVLALLGVGIGRARARGFSGLRALPAGYELSVLGAAIFLFGGVADMIWHIVFGIEVDVEALLSPTHLMLATGLALVLSGPARAAWRRAGTDRLVAEGWRAQLPMVLSLTYVLALFAFFTQYVHPLSSAWASTSWQPIGAIVPTSAGDELEIPFLFQAPMLAGTLVQTALLLGVILVGLRHARLPFGSMTLLVGLVTVMMLFMRERFVGDVRLPLLVASLFSGVAADVLLFWLRPAFSRPNAVRWFGTVVPVVVYGSYFAALLLTSGLWWIVHLWAGTIFMAGVVGYLMALLVTVGPPNEPLVASRSA